MAKMCRGLNGSESCSRKHGAALDVGGGVDGEMMRAIPASSIVQHRTGYPLWKDESVSF